MTNQVTANTPEEVRLLNAFRLMHREDSGPLLYLAESYVNEQRVKKPHLRLVSSEKRRSSDAKESA